MSAKRKRRCGKSLWHIACCLVSGHDGPCKGHALLGYERPKVFAVSWSKSSASELRRARAEWGES